MARKPMIVYGGVLVCVAVSCWFFPLFHVRKLDAQYASVESSKVTTGNEGRHAVNKESVKKDGELHVDGLQDRGQQEMGKPRKLEAYATKGIEVTKLWEAFGADKTKAKSQYGRQAGLGGAWYFCVRGQGTVASVEQDRVMLTVANSSRRICFELGPPVDNTVREAVGIKASDFKNSQEFNAVSTELNRQVEEEVIATNQSLLKPGAVVDFVGCAKISRDSDLDPLCLIPIQMKVSGNAGVHRGVTFGLAKLSSLGPIVPSVLCIQLKTGRTGQMVPSYVTLRPNCLEALVRQDAYFTGPSL